MDPTSRLAITMTPAHPAVASRQTSTRKRERSPSTRTTWATSRLSLRHHDTTLLIKCYRKDDLSCTIVVISSISRLCLLLLQRIGLSLHPTSISPLEPIIVLSHHNSCMMLGSSRRSISKVPSVALVLVASNHLRCINRSNHTMSHSILAMRLSLFCPPGSTFVHRSAVFSAVGMCVTNDSCIATLSLTAW